MDALLFDLPATYVICVGGFLDEKWSDRLGGMKIAHGLSTRGEPVTVLSGLLLDQAAVVGVLRGLHSLGLLLMNVARVEGEELSKPG